jgi:hypothetical protein
MSVTDIQYTVPPENCNIIQAHKMALHSNEQIVFRDHPLMFWFFGILPLGIAVLTHEILWKRLLLVLAGLAVIGLAPVLTVAVDSARGILHLHYRSPLRSYTKTFSLNEIGFVRIAEIRDSNRMFRVELILLSGEVVPLRKGYATGKAGKKRQAKKLRSALGIDAAEY